MSVKLSFVEIEKETDEQVIIGQGNFSVYTVDNIFRDLLTSHGSLKLGVAMNEAAPQLVRFNHNDPVLGERLLMPTETAAQKEIDDEKNVFARLSADILLAE